LNELIPDKETYQTNKRRMTWTALVMMVISTIAVIYDPERMNQASAIFMMMYGFLSAVVGAYFGFSASSGVKKQ